MNIHWHVVTATIKDKEQLQFTQYSPCPFGVRPPNLQLLPRPAVCALSFAFPRMPRNYTQTVWSLLHLTSFTYHNAVEIHPCGPLGDLFLLIAK